MTGVAIGDPVEVRFITMQGERWIPATVVTVDRHSIDVCFSDGERMDVMAPHWRRICG